MNNSRVSRRYCHWIVPVESLLDPTRANKTRKYNNLNYYDSYEYNNNNNVHFFTQVTIFQYKTTHTTYTPVK